MKWQHPMEFTGTYPTEWAGYSFLQWSSLGYWHEGVDYNYGGGDTDYGKPVYACADGYIEWVGTHTPGYGYHLFMRHEHPVHGVLYSHYAHLKEGSVSLLAGTFVTRGSKIAECGKTGWNSMWAHLHFEIRKPIGQGYGFWPDPKKGWTKEKITKYYFDPFLFIEENSRECDCSVEIAKATAGLKTEISMLEDKLEKKTAVCKEWQKKATEFENALLTARQDVESLQQQVKNLQAAISTNMTPLSVYKASLLVKELLGRLVNPIAKETVKKGVS